jgi:hypothetical protein
MKIISFYWILAPNIWISLIIGWIVIIISAITKFEFESSGAILCCCVIVAELMYKEWALYENFEKSSTFGASLYLPRYYRRKIREISSKKGKATWDISKSIHNGIHRVLAINLVIGTFIWAYGDYIIKSN